MLSEQEAVGQRLKSEIRRVGLTQKKVAAAAGVDQGAVSRFGSERSMRIEQLVHFLRVCGEKGMDLQYIFTGNQAVARSKAETSELARELATELLPQLAPHVGPRARQH